MGQWATIPAAPYSYCPQYISRIEAAYHEPDKVRMHHELRCRHDSVPPLRQRQHAPDHDARRRAGRELSIVPQKLPHLRQPRPSSQYEQELNHNGRGIGNMESNDAAVDRQAQALADVILDVARQMEERGVNLGDPDPPESTPSKKIPVTCGNCHQDFQMPRCAPDTMLMCPRCNEWTQMGTSSAGGILKGGTAKLIAASEIGGQFPPAFSQLAPIPQRLQLQEVAERSYTSKMAKP